MELPVLGNQIFQESLPILHLEIELVVGDLDLCPLLVGVVILKVFF